ncbi:MAG: response regulator [Candidatus Saccharimonadales bacterium]
MAKILLVEDDNNLREIFEMRLQAEGYSTVTAGDGEEALVVAMKEKPDLIIADVMMPKLSGFEMLETLRAAPEMKDVKVIMMTALGQAEDRSRGERLGVIKYLVKSQVTLEDFARVVKEVMQPPDTATAGASGASQANDITATNKQESESPMPDDTTSTNPAAPAPAGDSSAPATNPISGDNSAPADGQTQTSAQEQSVVTDQINNFVADTPAAPPAPTGDSGSAPTTDPSVPAPDPYVAPSSDPSSEPATFPAAEPAGTSTDQPYVPPATPPPADSPQPPASDQSGTPSAPPDSSANTI